MRAREYSRPSRPVQPQRHRGHREKHRGRHSEHEDTKESPSLLSIARCPQITQIDPDSLVDAAVARIYGETVGDLTIAAPGGKPVCSERERSSQPCCPPDDAPGARRFRLPRSCLERMVPSIHHQKMRSGEGCARFEHSPEDGETATNAGIRSRCPVLQSPAVVRRRPGSRHVLKSREPPSGLSG